MLSISKSSKTIKSIKKDIVIAFCISLFGFLKRKEMCFLSGSIIFEDNNNRLFNLLTYGDLDNKSEDCDKKKLLASSRITLTHKEVFDKPDVKVVESDEKCINLKRYQQSFKSIGRCEDGRCFKLELQLNKQINYLCGDDGNKKNKSTKQIILYYRFEHNNKKYLFFKLEAHPINSLGHLSDYINQSRRDTYEKRRENNSVYDEEIKEKDLRFYVSLLINEFKQLKSTEKIQIISNIVDNYNPLLRTGRELFIFEELKEFLLNELIPFYSLRFKK